MCCSWAQGIGDQCQNYWAWLLGLVCQWKTSIISRVLQSDPGYRRSMPDRTWPIDVPMNLLTTNQKGQGKQKIKKVEKVLLFYQRDDYECSRIAMGSETSFLWLRHGFFGFCGWTLHSRGSLETLAQSSSNKNNQYDSPSFDWKSTRSGTESKYLNLR